MVFAITACGAQDTYMPPAVTQEEAQEALTNIRPLFMELMHIFSPGLTNPDAGDDIFEDSEGRQRVRAYSDPNFPHILSTGDIGQELHRVFTREFTESTISPMLFQYYADMYEGLHRLVDDFPTTWPWNDEIVSFTSLSHDRFEAEVTSNTDNNIRIILVRPNFAWFIDYISWSD